LTAGAPGKRTALPNARVMIHQPWGGVQGQVSDIEIHARELLALKQRLNEILVKHTNQRSRRSSTTPTGIIFMSAEEAKAYGIIDIVYEKKVTPPARRSIFYHAQDRARCGQTARPFVWEMDTDEVPGRKRLRTGGMR